MDINYKAITAIYTLGVGDQVVDCTSGTFTVTLPTAVGITGKAFTLKNSGAGSITLDGDGSETIDGVTTKVLAANDSVTVLSDNVNWILI